MSSSSHEHRRRSARGPSEVLYGPTAASVAAHQQAFEARAVRHRIGAVVGAPEHRRIPGRKPPGNVRRRQQRGPPADEVELPRLERPLDHHEPIGGDLLVVVDQADVVGARCGDAGVERGRLAAPAFVQHTERIRPRRQPRLDRERLGVVVDDSHRYGHRPRTGRARDALERGAEQGGTLECRDQQLEVHRQAT
jgi:hypothetical protein